jgi:hypothetical protein
MIAGNGVILRTSMAKIARRTELVTAKNCPVFHLVLFTGENNGKAVRTINPAKTTHK